VQAANITLQAANSIGGLLGGANGVIDIDEVLTQSGDFLGAIDIDLKGGTLTVTQTGAGGHVQLREVDGALLTSQIVKTLTAPGTQFALIASGGANVGTAPGALLVDAALTLS